MITYTDNQQQVLQRIRDFLQNDSSIFILQGYAGTGKTTLLRPIIDEISKANKEYLLMAPTGRAAKILTEKTHVSAGTIHRSIYSLECVDAVDGNEEAESSVKYMFPIKKFDISPKSLVGVVDEASMVGCKESSCELYRFGSGNLLNDLLETFMPQYGGKLIFVGDPAQLPPVGEKDSMALCSEYFEEMGLKTETAVLSEVLRQNTNSAIYSNAMKFRDLLGQEQRNTLTFDIADGECMSIDESRIVSRFVEISPRPSLDSPVVICFSNSSAADYNYNIRKLYFEGSVGQPVKDDILLVAGNNYFNSLRAIMNGEFLQVLEVSDVLESQSAPVYVKEYGEHVRKVITLCFRDVKIRLDDGKEGWIKIIDSLLNNDKRDLNYAETCALYINFCMRNPHLIRGTEEFKKAITTDPYVNALKVKYGYAITGHKSQGGEWDTIFIDYRGRTGLNNDCLRWAYTATTRAKKTLYCANMPDITPFSSIKVKKAIPFAKYPSGSVSYVNVPENQFHDENAPVFLKAKYHNAERHLWGSAYKIVKVESFSYRERYYIEDASGTVHIVDVVYNGAGIFNRFTSSESSGEIQTLLEMLNAEDEYCLGYIYTPSNETFENLHKRVKSISDDMEIRILNVVEYLSQYKIIYFFRFLGTDFHIEFAFDKNFNITFAQPRFFKDNQSDVADKFAEKLTL